MNKISVGIGEMKISKDKNEVVVVYGLGSCVAVVAYDAIARIGGILHVLLSENNNTQTENYKEFLKYADTGIPMFISAMEDLGATRFSMEVKLIGAAHMFPSINEMSINIGEDNVRIAKEILKKHFVRIVAEDIGGVIARTIQLFINSGKVLIKFTDGSIKTL